MSAPAPDRQDQAELALRLRNTMVASASIPQDQVELPLRPRNTTIAASAPNSQDEPELALGQLPLTFAIDVSQSTLGPVLRKEQDAIREICGDSMPPDLVSRSSILPWCHTAFQPMKIADIENLSSWGRTDPGALLNSPACKSKLQDASIWFLLTDGQITEPLVQKFAHAISAAGIQGTACVIILFGYPESSPFRCNISVGMSVFAVAPHCIFLFSDVRTGILYVLQAKGNFSNILPAEKQFVPFGERTEWADLVTIRYDDLKRVKVPRPIKMSRDIVILPNGVHFDMNSIYTGLISETDTLHLLSNYAALDRVILAAKTQGQIDKIQSWISNSRRTMDSMDKILLGAREDLGGEAKRVLLSLLTFLGGDGSRPQSLWQAILKSNQSSTAEFIKSELRKQHQRNWENFKQHVRAAHDHSYRLKMTFEDVSRRSSGSTRRQSSMSPSDLTPMSSPDAGNMQYMGTARSFQQRISPLANLSRPPADGPIDCEYLFLPGYRDSRNVAAGCAVPQNYQQCPICGTDQAIQCLLLQTPRDYNGTHHVPQVNSCAEHRYPMVLGSYPETDIILPLSACDACAWILLQVRELPNGQRVDAALPLVSLTKEANRRQWVRTLDRIYERRFHESIILYVFLSSVCFKMEDISKNREIASSLMEYLKWCSRAISQLPGEPWKAGLLPAPESTPTANHRLLTLQRVFRTAFPHYHTTSRLESFLHYPIEGSVVFVRIASQMETIAPHMIELYVWKRLLYQIAEHYAALRREEGPEEADIRLRATLEQLPSPYSVSVAQLGSHLPSLDQFRRLDNYFAPIETTTKYNAALAVFLHIMRKVSILLQHNHPEVGLFIKYIEDYGLQVQQADNQFCNVFNEPTLVGGGDVEKMVKDVYELH
ncbi:glucosidase II beta subunit-like family protein [Aspergillus tubingensis]|uniref:glucosidase II beta subunit-like family protein n=1 Tax=Aspergillus tubingensis TaxID=5068 RepID=UPI001578A87E|nr:glucosidase II beta subunit-like family protein [Aspergillus tubingensis]GFN20197.1 glucosidase II beta subunit-like family protein [Aspergillus tubingensis]